jgi:hypothetical protein
MSARTRNEKIARPEVQVLSVFIFLPSFRREAGAQCVPLAVPVRLEITKREVVTVL